MHEERTTAANKDIVAEVMENSSRASGSVGQQPRDAEGPQQRLRPQTGDH
jgi:hypothetical protein